MGTISFYSTQLQIDGFVGEKGGAMSSTTMISTSNPYRLIRSFLGFQFISICCIPVDVTTNSHKHFAKSRGNLIQGSQHCRVVKVAQNADIHNALHIERKKSFCLCLHTETCCSCKNINKHKTNKDVYIWVVCWLQAKFVVIRSVCFSHLIT